MNHFEIEKSLFSIKQMKKLLDCIILPFLFFIQGVSAQSVNHRYALLIGGLGGTDEHRVKFHGYLRDTREMLINRFQFQGENIVVLADARSPEESFINDISSAENIRMVFSDLSDKMTQEDDLFVILFGHGSYDGSNAMLNIPRQDLKDADYVNFLTDLRAHRIVLINTASCSGPFVQALSGPNRVIITATHSGGERIETVFPMFFVSAMRENGADLDKNGDLTLLEIFEFASQSTAKYYTEKDQLATEHALLEDTGDRIGCRVDELSESGEGKLASTIFLLRSTSFLATATADSITLNLLRERETISNEINQLRAEKESYQEYIYFDRLEPLFIRLAQINDEIERLEAGQKD